MSSKFGHYYDLTKSMEAEKLENADSVMCDVQNTGSDQKPNCMLEASYRNLLKNINDVIEAGGFGTSATPSSVIYYVSLFIVSDRLCGEILAVTITLHIYLDFSIP